MKGLNTVLCFALLAALTCRAQESVVVEDEGLDIPAGTESGLDLAKITFSRKGSSKIEIDFRMNGSVPRDANGDYVIITYLDIDNNPNTGLSRGEAGTDLDVFAFKSSGHANWECKLNKTYSMLAKESFQISKFNQYKDGFTIDVSSPLFKKAIRLRGYAESISNGKAIDRAPAEDFFTWDETSPKTD